MIELKDVSKSYGGKMVLDHINIQFKKGKISCILGGSGVGKTTLLNTIANIEDFSGEILGVEGKISYAFQTPCLVENMTVKQNISFACGEVKDDEMLYCLKKLQLSSLENSLAKNLSEGEKQRVNFLRALLYYPKLLMLDETFSFLDVKSKLLCEKLLLEYKQKCDFTVIMVTHDYSLALSLADEIIILSQNNIEIISTKESKLTEKQLKDRLLLAFNV